MKLVQDFRNLLENKVNLDETRLGLLDERVDAVFDVLRVDDGIGSYVKDKIPQGSWAHKTIIRPRPGQEFDADFLVRMEEVPDWHDQPVEYLKYLRKVLAGHWRYGDKPVTRKRRCVRLVYAGDCHLDIVPFVRRADGSTWIVNGEDDVWEPTNPEGYSAWMREKDEATGGNLRKVVRLLKFIRDRQDAFSGTRSIILTTVVGDRVDRWRTLVDPGYYADIPTTLLHVVEDLDTWLQDNSTRPSIADPSAPGASFDHRWTDETYAVLRSDVHDYRGLIHDAFHAGVAESRALWRDIFGTGFPDPASATTSGRFGTPPPVPGRSGRAG